MSELARVRFVGVIGSIGLAHQAVHPGARRVKMTAAEGTPARPWPSRGRLVHAEGLDRRGRQLWTTRPRMLLPGATLTVDLDGDGRPVAP